MKNHCLSYFAAVLLFQLINFEMHAQAPEFEWAKRAGGPEGDAGSRIAVDADGNSYATGIFRGVSNFGSIELTSSGVADIFIAKYDAAGNVLWAKQAGGTDIDAGKNIAVDSNGNSYITGEFLGSATFDNTTLTSNGDYDAFIAKYDASGNVLWVKQSGGTGLEVGRGIAVDGNGNPYITGYFNGNAIFNSTTLTSAGSYDIFIAKYDASGNFQWAERAGSNGDDFARNVAVDGSDNSYIVGTFRGLARFDSTALISSGLEDLFIAKYDPAGNVIWAKKAGGTSKDAANGIDVDDNGNSFITGEFQGNATFGNTVLTSTSFLADIFIASYDATGNVLWAKNAGGTFNDYGRNIEVDGGGNSYITGEFEGSATFGSTTLTSSGGVDIFIAAYDDTGNSLWAKRAGGNLEDRAAGIALDGSGNTYISGYFVGEASFGSTTITSSGAGDIYVAKLSSVTSIPNSTGFHISTYPNPFASFLTINLITTDPATATLTDMLGREVHRQELIPQAAGTEATLTPAHYLPSGAYLLRVHQGNTVRQVLVVRGIG